MYSHYNNYENVLILKHIENIQNLIQKSNSQQLKVAMSTW